MKVISQKTCYCHTCKRYFHWLGITQHRKAHKVRRQDCKITFTHGNTVIYEYSKIPAV